MSEVSGIGFLQAFGSWLSPAGRITVQPVPVVEVTTRPFCWLSPPSPALRLKAMRRPSGEITGLSSMTLQVPGQAVWLRSLCWPSASAGTVMMCLLPPLPLITSVLVKAISLPSGDQEGSASDAACCPSGGSMVPTISPVDTRAITIRAGPAAVPTPPGRSW